MIIFFYNNALLFSITRIYTTNYHKYVKLCKIFFTKLLFLLSMNYNRMKKNLFLTNRCLRNTKEIVR